jgi:hypothetical protein
MGARDKHAKKTTGILLPIIERTRWLPVLGRFGEVPSAVRQIRCAPFPLWGRGWGGGSRVLRPRCNHLGTPHPVPPGGEHAAFAARLCVNTNGTRSSLLNRHRIPLLGQVTRTLASELEMPTLTSVALDAGDDVSELIKGLLQLLKCNPFWPH